MSYTIPEIRESKSIPNVVAISGIEPEPIANFFLILILKYAYVNIISIFCYQTVIINILQTKYRCGYFLYIRHYFPDFLIILYTTKPQKPKSLGLISSIYSVIRYDYSMMEATVPDPTVRPPSRIANLRPSSIATGWISSTVIVT